MPVEFKPFLPTSAAHAPANGSANAFAPLTSPPAAAEPAPNRCADVKVELKRDGDRVTSIRVHCRCGEVIELACEY